MADVMGTAYVPWAASWFPKEPPRWTEDDFPEPEYWDDEPSEPEGDDGDGE